MSILDLGLELSQTNTTIKIVISILASCLCTQLLEFHWLNKRTLEYRIKCLNANKCNSPA